MRPKVDIIEWLKFKYAYFKVTGWLFIYYATGTLSPFPKGIRAKASIIVSLNLLTTMLQSSMLAIRPIEHSLMTMVNRNYLNCYIVEYLGMVNKNSIYSIVNKNNWPVLAIVVAEGNRRWIKTVSLIKPRKNTKRNNIRIE